MGSINGLGWCVNEIAQFLYKEEQYEDLLQLISNVLHLYYEHIGKIGVEIGETHVLMGEMYERRARPNEARLQWLKAISIFQKIREKGWLAVALSGLGENERDRGEWSQAAQDFHKVIEILQREFPEYKLDLANGKRSLANALLMVGKAEEIKDEGWIVVALNALGENHRGWSYETQHCHDAVEMLQREFPENKLDLADAKRSLGIALLIGGKVEEAIDIFKEIVDEGWLAVALSALGKNQLDIRGWSKAVQSFGQVVEILQRKFPENKLDSENAKRSLGNALLKIGKLEEALNHFKEIEDELWIAVALNLLGENKLVRGEWSEAVQSFQQVVEILQRRFPENKWELANTKRSMGKALLNIGKVEEAIDIFKKIRDKKWLAVALRARRKVEIRGNT